MARKRDRLVAPTSDDVDEFSAELRYAGDRDELVARINRVRATIAQLPAEDRNLVEVGRAAKKNFAQRFSEAIAQKTANALRAELPDVLPDAAGGGHEWHSKGAGGLKKLDVNYSTRKSGLELAVSIKTINFKDDATGRYTKNVKRVDGELRAEATDCHKRQPYAVLAAILFLPADSAADGEGQGTSSLRHASNVLEFRSGRASHKDDEGLFEMAFIALYEPTGQTSLFTPGDSIPKIGKPANPMAFSTVVASIVKAHRNRNSKR